MYNVSYLSHQFSAFSLIAPIEHGNRRTAVSVLVRKVTVVIKVIKILSTIVDTDRNTFTKRGVYACVLRFLM